MVTFIVLSLLQVIEYQWEMLETLGVTKDWGVACLNRIGQDYPPNTQINQMLHQKMQMFMNSAQVCGS